ncbi:MAG: hypothetical protein JWQ73_240 [Variovorax sp.]|jgi:hypothetical protein|nr:hypothetical protein [Variovorax sp.]
MLNALCRIAAFAMLCLMAGCASITGGNTQQMYVQVNNPGGAPVSKAECALSNDKGKWSMRPPEAITIARSNQAMLISCTSAASPAGSTSVESTTRAAMYGNLLFGGLIGVGIDHFSGAAYEYPGVATVTMGRSSSVQMAYAPPGSAGGPTAVARTMPSVSGFAAIDDVASVPGPESVRNTYRKFLAQPLPRAMAISDNGHAWYADGYRTRDPNKPGDPNLRALQGCREVQGTNCRLYAVDRDVVYVREAPSTQASASAGVPTVPKISRYALPPESLFADVNDASLVPVRDEGRGKYLQFLTLPLPRAFAIATDGAWTVASDSASAMADVLNACEREGKTCWLYAADDRVVWQTDLRHRVGRVNQLLPAEAR